MISTESYHPRHSIPRFFYSGLTFDQIGKAIGRDEVWVAAAFYGQAKFTPEELRKVLEVLSLEVDIMAAAGDQWWPQRGLGPMPPTDPVIYRLYEVRYHTEIWSVVFVDRLSGCTRVRGCYQGESRLLILMASLLTHFQAVIHEKVVSCVNSIQSW